VRSDARDPRGVAISSRSISTLRRHVTSRHVTSRHVTSRRVNSCQRHTCPALRFLFTTPVVFCPSSSTKSANQDPGTLGSTFHDSNSHRRTFLPRILLIRPRIFLRHLRTQTTLYIKIINKSQEPFIYMRQLSPFFLISYFKDYILTYMPTIL